MRDSRRRLPRAQARAGGIDRSRQAPVPGIHVDLVRVLAIGRLALTAVDLDPDAAVLLGGIGLGQNRSGPRRQEPAGVREIPAILVVEVGRL